MTRNGFLRRSDGPLNRGPRKALVVVDLGTINLRKDKPYIIYEGVFNPIKNSDGMKFVSGEEFFKYLKERD